MSYTAVVRVPKPLTALMSAVPAEGLDSQGVQGSPWCEGARALQAIRNRDGLCEGACVLQT